MTSDIDPSPFLPEVPARRLFALMRPAAVTIAMAAVLSVAAALVSLVQPLVVRDAFDRFETNEGPGSLIPIIVALFVLEAALGALLTYLLGRSGERIVYDLRKTMVGRLLRWPIAGHEKHEPGDLISRVNADTGAIRGVVASSLSEFVSGAVVFIGAVILMLTISPLLLLVTLACLAGAVVLLVIVAAGIMLATQQAQTALGRLSAGLEGVFRSMRMVKLNNAEDREHARLSAELDRTYAAGLKLAKLEAWLSPATTIAVQAALVIVLWIGGSRVATGDLSLGNLIAFLLYLLYLVVPVASVFSSFTSFQAARAALARVEEVLAEEPEDLGDTPDSAGTTNTAPPAISFDRVSFAYPSRAATPVLDELSFTVRPGSCIALVGTSGGGKSTTLALIARLYEASSGRIAIDGRPVTEFSLTALREQIGYVEQDSPVTSSTVRQNLGYGAPDVSDAELWEALRMTNLDAFVQGLPDGIDSRVGAGGALLSGGQRQRIAIARALLRQTPMLLLDEITANMDGENEGHLNETLDRLKGDHTIIMAAHRLSTIRRADEIHVLAHGRIVASGTHDDLFERSPDYRLLAAAQLGRVSY